MTPKSKKPPSRRGLFASKRQHRNWPTFTPPRRPEIAPPLTNGMRWSVLELAALSHVGHSTINRFENEQSTCNHATRAAIRRAFEDAGVEFIEDYGVMIREGRSATDE